jgi:methoxymalonate biosynthesis acyl carrier protein
MPTDHDPRELVRDYLLVLTGLPAVGDDQALLSTHTLESIAAVLIVAFVERTFAIQLDDEDLVLDNFDTLDGIVRLVERRRAAT